MFTSLISFIGAKAIGSTLIGIGVGLIGDVAQATIKEKMYSDICDKLEERGWNQEKLDKFIETASKEKKSEK